MVLDGEVTKQKREWDEARWHSHHLAHLVAFSFNDPNNIPQFDAAKQADSALSDEVNQARVRGAFIRDALRAEMAKGA